MDVLAISLDHWEQQQCKDGIAVMVRCPDCQCKAALGNHAIDGEGYVTPEAHCPVCGFSDHLRLQGWGMK